MSRNPPYTPRRRLGASAVSRGSAGPRRSVLDARAVSGLALLTASCWLGGCATAGSTWMANALSAEEATDANPNAIVEPTTAAYEPSLPRSKTLRNERLSNEAGMFLSPASDDLAENSEPPYATAPQARAPRALVGRVLGTFRNTYYFFPNETNYSGSSISIKGPRCEDIRSVPSGFFEALCVQGSGTLSTGVTVSFARRDCECAAVCPRTQQKICFDTLDRRQFPWGRGAAGQAITPLLSVAVDVSVVPLGTAMYVPEYDGLPIDSARSSFHDGCFIAQDRGLKVQGKHLDVFTGDENVTALWNSLVPSNQGVTVVLDSPRCHRAEP